MTPYQPKLSHCLFTSLLSALFGYLWAVSPEGKVSTVMGLTAFMFFGMTCFLFFLVGESSHYWSVTRYLEMLIKLDPDLRNALALKVPSLRLVATRGKVRELFENTNATKDHWLLFLQDSTRENTASRRKWVTAERPAWAWKEIYEHLLRQKMVGTRAVGPDSFPWIGTAYQNCMVYWLGTHDLDGSQWADMTGTEEEETRTYAQDDT